MPLSAEAWKPVRSSRQGIEVPFPDRDAWAVNDVGGQWLVAQHAGSRSEVRLRSWRAPRVNTSESCWEQVRLWRPDFPGAETGSILEQRDLTAPAGYRGEVLVGVTVAADVASGFVAAVGARGGRCFAFWYRTRVSGGTAEQIVGENLAVVSAGMVDRVRELALDEAVHREGVSP